MSRGVSHLVQTLTKRLNGATKEKPFESNIGSPQGDSLSPVLYSIYSENALKEVRTILPRPTSDFEKTLPTEIVYADNVDFIRLEFADIAEVQKTLKKYNLLVNADKHLREGSSVRQFGRQRPLRIRHRRRSQCRQDRTNNTVKIRQRIQERKESRHTDRRRRRHQ